MCKLLVVRKTNATGRQGCRFVRRSGPSVEVTLTTIIEAKIQGAEPRSHYYWMQKISFVAARIVQVQRLQWEGDGGLLTRCVIIMFMTENDDIGTGTRRPLLVTSCCTICQSIPSTVSALQIRQLAQHAVIPCSHLSTTPPHTRTSLSNFFFFFLPFWGLVCMYSGNPEWGLGVDSVSHRLSFDVT